MRTLAALFLLASAAPADDVELTSGRVVSGKVEDLGDSIRITKSGSSVVYPKSMVKTITPRKTSEDLYQEKTRALKADDVDGRAELARWCLAEKLSRESAEEYRKVLALRPDHEEARKALGYQLHKGAWRTEDEVNADKGLVKHKGRWMAPEERDLELALEEQKELDRALLREVQTQLERFRSADPKKRDDAVAALAKIEDKYKVKSFLAALSTLHKETRRLAIEELGRIKEPSAVKPLARRALWDEEETYRALAFRALESIGHADTALHFLPFLAEDSVSARIRCIEALMRFKDPRSVGYLLAALDACLQKLNNLDPGGDTTTTVVNKTIVLQNGSTVTVPKVVKVKAESPDKALQEKLKEERSAIAAALRSLTGQDHGEDPAAWRAGLSKKKKE